MMTEPVTGGVALKVVESIARFFALFQKHKTEKLEDEVLEYMAHNRDWQSAKSIWAEKYLNTVLPGVPLSYFFRPADMKGWKRIKSRLLWTCFKVKIVWRKFSYLPSEGTIKKVLFSLWKSGHLQRASFNAKYYRLK
jgi:hypothetical protein